MDVTDSKGYKTYDGTSRYSSVPYYYNRLDGKYVYGVGKQLSTSTAYTVHELASADTLDSLALKYYGRPDYFWIIADFNRIQDPFMKLSDRMESVKIPSLSSIEYED